MFYLHSPANDAALPEKVYIEPTSMCNLRCSICFRHSWIGEPLGHMARPVFEALAAELNALPNVHTVFFGGMGEPLFHPDIVEMVRAIGPHKCKELLTNGTLLSAERAQALVEAGLDRLWISLDGFDSGSYEAIQQGSQFSRVCENLRLFNAARAGTNVRLGITFVVTRENRRQLESINAFADEVGADLLNISHVIPGAPIPKDETLYDDPAIPVGKMPRYAPFANETEEHVCPFVSQNCVFVRWDGVVAPCMQLLHHSYTYLFEQRREIHAFAYGRIPERTLMQCWHDAEYHAFRHRVNTFYFPFCTVCWGCEDRETNLSDCFLGEAPTCGACMWATGKVFCP